MKRELNKKTKYIIVMLIGVLMNMIFYTVASLLNLPVWFDLSGTALVSIMLEPASGIIVGFINNFYLSLIQQDIGTIIYFAVSAAVAVICGVCMRDKDGKVSAKRILPTLLLVFVVSTVLSSLLTIWKSDGVSNGKWELFFYQWALDAGFPKYISTFFGAGIVKIFDTLGNAVMVAIFYFVLPTSLKNQRLIEK